MHQLSSTVGVVGVAGTAVAVLALLTSAVLGLRVRRLCAAQRVVLGEGERDLVRHAADLDSEFGDLTRYVRDAVALLDGRIVEVERRLDHALAHRALIRYDAYGEMSGQQSTSLALLDSTRSGVVLSSIHHRDQARLYAKQIRNGEPELQLSPEEEEAVETAMRNETAAS